MQALETPSTRPVRACVSCALLARQLLHSASQRLYRRDPACAINAAWLALTAADLALDGAIHGQLAERPEAIVVDNPSMPRVPAMPVIGPL